MVDHERPSAPLAQFGDFHLGYSPTLKHTPLHPHTRWASLLEPGGHSHLTAAPSDFTSAGTTMSALGPPELCAIGMQPPRRTT